MNRRFNRHRYLRPAEGPAARGADPDADTTFQILGAC